MQRPIEITRTRWRQRAKLETLYANAKCPRFRTRVQMILLTLEGHGTSEVSKLVRKSDDAVRYWIRRYEAEGWRGLVEKPHHGRPPVITRDIECFLLKILDTPPREYGVDRPTWTTAHMAEAIEVTFGVKVTDECVRKHLARIEIVCRRPTWSVKHMAEAQPGYAQKKLQSHGY